MKRITQAHVDALAAVAKDILPETRKPYARIDSETRDSLISRLDAMDIQNQTPYDKASFIVAALEIYFTS